MRSHNSPRIFFYSLLLIASMGMPVAMCFASTGQISPTSALPYTELGNVTYRMQMELKLINDDVSPLEIEIFAPHVLNWSIGVPDADTSLQTASLLGNATSGFDVANFSQSDKFNNSIDYYKKNLPVANSFTLSMNYTITARQIRWDNLGTPLMSAYETATPFYKLYTQNQPPFINITDPAINQTAAMICGGDTSPVEKARKIYKWVSTNLTYKVQSGGTDGTGEKGASWALANLEGDCSEYSDLMVAMLRVQGVPARKVTGLAMLDAGGNHLPSYAAGATWTYYQHDTTDNYTGHAWIEYYVPGCGWVACDPTWGNSGQDYFNYIDYLHVSACRGENFGDEVYPTLPSLIGYEIGEYPFLPLVVFPGGAILSSTTTTRLTVIESNIWIDYTWVILLVGISLIIAVIGIIYWVARKRRE